MSTVVLPRRQALMWRSMWGDRPQGPIWLDLPPLLSRVSGCGLGLCPAPPEDWCCGQPPGSWALGSS